MTTPDPSQSLTSELLGSRRLRAVVAVVIIIGIAALVLAIWYIFLRPAGPPPIGPGAPVIPDGALSGHSLASLATLAIV